MLDQLSEIRSQVLSWNSQDLGSDVPLGLSIDRHGLAVDDFENSSAAATHQIVKIAIRPNLQINGGAKPRGKRQ